MRFDIPIQKVQEAFYTLVPETIHFIPPLQIASVMLVGKLQPHKIRMY
jgi:hypothetical protein